MRTLYGSCMGAEGIAHPGLAPLRQLLDNTTTEITGHDVISLIRNPSFNWSSVPDAINQAALKLGVQPLLRFDVGWSECMASTPQLMVGPDAVKQDDMSADAIEQMFRLVFPAVDGKPPVNWTAAAAEVAGMATELQAVYNATKDDTSCTVFVANDIRSHAHWTLPGLPILPYLQERLRAAQTGLSIPDLDRRLVALSGVQELRELLARNGSGRAVSYLLWKAMQPWVSKSQHQQPEDTDSGDFAPLWKVCVEQVDEAMPHAVLRQLIRNDRFTLAEHTAVLDMVTSLQEELGDRIQATDWLDNDDRLRAVRKVAAINHRIGLLDYSGDADKVEQLYSDLQFDGQAFVANMLALRGRQFGNAYQLNKRNRSSPEWLDGALDSMWYSKLANEVVVPASEIGWPMFHLLQPDYVNYGALGMALGHELGHSMGTTNVYLDEHGNTPWLSPSALNAYHNRTECLVAHYSNFTLPQADSSVLALDGRRILDENVADYIGLRLAWTAWQAQRGTKYVPLPGLSDLSPEQLFFVTVGQTFCLKVSSKSARTLWTEGVHSYGHSRVNGLMQNSPEFASAFNCAPGTPMNPVHKCQLF
ncbi:Peptidase M13 [Sorochytrium milnesiophthora]